MLTLLLHQHNAGSNFIAMAASPSTGSRPGCLLFSLHSLSNLYSHSDYFCIYITLVLSSASCTQIQLSADSYTLVPQTLHF